MQTHCSRSQGCCFQRELTLSATASSENPTQYARRESACRTITTIGYFEIGHNINNYRNGLQNTLVGSFSCGFFQRSSRTVLLRSFAAVQTRRAEQTETLYGLGIDAVACGRWEATWSSVKRGDRM